MKAGRMLGVMSKNQKDSYAVAVGERLALARREAVPKITQARAAEQLSEVMGETFTSSAVANYEQGLRLPSPPIVDALCQIYGTATASYILGLSDAATSVRELKMLQKYRIADERGKYAIDSLADSQSAIVSDDRGNEKTGT
jgi:transcriptional regulator with XRE-family HTH domain